MSDIVGALVAMLKADAGVAALAGTRVFGGELPADETAAMPRAAIVIAPSGGVSLTGASFLEADTQRVDLVAWGATPLSAAALLAAADEAMRGARRASWANVLIYWVNRAGGYAAARDRDGQWPFAFRSYQVFHAL